MPDRQRAVATRGSNATGPGGRKDRRLGGAVLGGVAVGIGLSAVMLLGEWLSGKPSELIELERATAARLAIATPTGPAPATATEQAITHGGHLALSALAGVAYVAAVDEAADGPAAGAAFGAGFFVAAYGIAGPALGVTPLPWRQPLLRAVQHPVVHVLFGLAIAASARRATKG